GSSGPFTDANGTPSTAADAKKIPGLTVTTHGFKVGTAELTFRPGGAGAGSSINFFGIISFDDLRIGVENFAVNFPGAQPAFNGNIFFASGGVHFLPGKTISGEIVDGPDADTEAVRATLEFENEIGRAHV